MCIFCDIIDGQEEVSIIYEDVYVVALWISVPYMRVNLW